MAKPENFFSDDELAQLLKSGAVVAAKRDISEPFRLFQISENISEVLGFHAEDLTASESAWHDLIHPDDQCDALDFYKAAIQKNEAECLEYRIQHSDGNFISVLEETKPFTNSKGEKVLLSTILKVLDVKSAEFDRIEKEYRSRLEYQNVLSRCSNLLIDSAGPKTVDKALELLLQITDTDRVYIFTSTKKNGEVYISQTNEAVRDGVESVVHDPSMQNMPFNSLPWVFGQLSANNVVNIPIKNLPETERDFMQDQDIKSFLLLPVFIDDEWFGFLGFDSTRQEKIWGKYEISILRTAAEIIGTYFKRKAVEESLISQKNFTRQILNSLPSITVVVNKKLEVVQWNKLAEKLTGYNPEEIKNLTAYDFVAPEDYGEMKAALMRILNNKSEGQELNLITKHGKIIPYYWRGNTIKMSGETMFVVVGLNISEQKKMESALIEEKQLADALINSLPGIFYMLDKDANFVRVNKNFTDEFGYEESELRSISPFDFYASEEIPLMAGKMEEVFEKGYADVEMHPLRKDGTREPYYLKAIRLDRGGESFIIGTGHSIKEQKQRESELEASIHEKQVLLQEIHHRVKNNLAVISGLLELQVNEHEDPEFQRLVMDSQRRIQTMAIIHEKLYQSESLSQISMLLYMNDLIEQIGNSFSIDSRNIKIETSIEDVELSINQAIPFALAMNEIISNSLEHAYKGKSGGNLTIRLTEEDDTIHTIIKDDGIGFNSEESEQSSSLGMTLITALLTQVGAEWKVNSENGVTYDIVFNKMPVEFLTDPE